MKQTSVFAQNRLAPFSHHIKIECASITSGYIPPRAEPVPGPLSRAKMPSFAEIASLLDASSIFLFLVTLVVFSIPVFIIFPPIPVERSDALGQTHSKVGIPQRESNLRDQYQTAQTRSHGANGHAATSQPTPKIHSLHIYPLKSCRGIELTEATVLPTGLEHDRVFCLAQRKTRKRTGRDAAPPEPAASLADTVDYWEVLTLRQMAPMVGIKVDLWLPDSSKHSRQLGPMTADDGTGHSDSFLVVRFPWRSAGVKGFVETVAAKLSRGLSATPEREFMLSMGFPSDREVKARGYSHAEVTHFRNVIPALNMGAELPTELALYLGLEPGQLAVFRLDPDHRRQVFDCAPTREVAGYQPEIDFQDAYPLHLLNLSSVRALESKIRRDADIDRLDCRRFRPNIVVSGLPEYDEDDWKSIRFKAASRKDTDALFDVSCRTVRQVIPLHDLEKKNTCYAPQREYLSMQLIYRLALQMQITQCRPSYWEIDAGAPKKGCMGMQMCPLFSTDGVQDDLQSTIRVGMEIAVLKRGTHRAL
ncbi:MOSC domain containing protein [Cordyceps militaris CM01]|uniref:MOSC domain containing protein n=1 Tax=Cordyceps militaris (strain CM01) TaxID=983644 RepID=G3JJ40_CORMM|nr:MOSC domain containing protein [Cordyceps militaris CM01]EGX91187.1 MOSC domain containing protein [Cordyceps militaris CM01]